MKLRVWLMMVLVLALLGAIIIIGMKAREAEQQPWKPTAQIFLAGASNASVSTSPTLLLAESNLIIERALQRIKRRLIQTRNRIPGLSEVATAEVRNGGFIYHKGHAALDGLGKPHLDPPDACSIEIFNTHYRSKGSEYRNIYQYAPKIYDLGNDYFEYIAVVVIASGSEEIHGVIEQEMDKAADELRKAGSHKRTFWPFW